MWNTVNQLTIEPESTANPAPLTESVPFFGQLSVDQSASDTSHGSPQKAINIIECVSKKGLDKRKDKEKY